MRCVFPLARIMRSDALMLMVDRARVVYEGGISDFCDEKLQNVENERYCGSDCREVIVEASPDIFIKVIPFFRWLFVV